VRRVAENHVASGGELLAVTLHPGQERVLRIVGEHVGDLLGHIVAERIHHRHLIDKGEMERVRIDSGRHETQHLLEFVDGFAVEILVAVAAHRTAVGDERKHRLGSRAGAAGNALLRVAPEDAPRLARADRQTVLAAGAAGFRPRNDARNSALRVEFQDRRGAVADADPAADAAGFVDVKLEFLHVSSFSTVPGFPGYR